MKTSIKNLLVVDDHQAIGELIVIYFQNVEEYKICSVSSSVKEAKQELKKHKIDIVITDISLEEEDGLELIKFIKNEYPQVKVLVFTMHINSITIAESLSRGADGYLPKSSSLEALQKALSDISAGKRYLSGEVTNKLVDGISNVQQKSQIEGRSSQLTRREFEILQEVLNGKSNKVIANELHISLRTVENHRSNILRKMGVSNFYSLLHLKKD